MKQIKYYGITYSGDYLSRTVDLPNQMLLEDAIEYVKEQNGTDDDDILYYQAFMGA